MNLKNMGKWPQCRSMEHQKTAMVWCFFGSRRIRRKLSLSPKESCSLACLLKSLPGAVLVGDDKYRKQDCDEFLVPTNELKHFMKLHFFVSIVDSMSLTFNINVKLLRSLRNGEWKWVQAIGWEDRWVPPKGHKDTVYRQPWEDHQLPTTSWYFSTLWRNCGMLSIYLSIYLEHFTFGKGF